jgi:hypothetical protein
MEGLALALALVRPLDLMPGGLTYSAGVEADIAHARVAAVANQVIPAPKPSFVEQVLAAIWPSSIQPVRFA